DHRDLPRAVGVREHPHRRRGRGGRQRPAVARRRLRPPGERARRGAARDNRACGTGGPHGERARAWRPARRRDGDGAEPAAEAPAARRADRRHGPGRDRAHGEAHQRAARAHQAEHPLHRARHGARLRPRPPHHRAQLRQGAGERRAQGCRGRSPGAGRLSRGGGMSATVLKVDNIHTFYGKSHILHGVSMEVNEGEIVTLLGRNGAGKTTTLRSLSGLTPARDGRVEIFGQDTTRWRSYTIARLGVGYVPEGRRIFPNLTVLENLAVPVTRPGSWTIPRVLELFPNLGARRDSLGRQLSGGEQEMLAIARALLVNPRLLLLDEPSQGLAPL